MRTTLITSAVALTALALLAPALARADTVTDWNGYASNAIVVTAGQPPPSAVLSFAMVQGAVYDAVNAIDRGHRAYLPSPGRPARPRRTPRPRRPRTRSSPGSSRPSSRRSSRCTRRRSRGRRQPARREGGRDRRRRRGSGARCSPRARTTAASARSRPCTARRRASTGRRRRRSRSTRPPGSGTSGRSWSRTSRCSASAPRTRSRAAPTPATSTRSRASARSTAPPAPPTRPRTRDLLAGPRLRPLEPRVPHHRDESEAASPTARGCSRRGPRRRRRGDRLLEQQVPLEHVAAGHRHPRGRERREPATEGDTGWTPLFDPSTPVAAQAPLVTPPFPEYPSGHNCAAGAILSSLRYFFGTDRVAFSPHSNKTGTTRSFDAASPTCSGRTSTRVSGPASTSATPTSKASSSATGSRSISASTTSSPASDPAPRPRAEATAPTAAPPPRGRCGRGGGAATGPRARRACARSARGGTRRTAGNGRCSACGSSPRARRTSGRAGNHRPLRERTGRSTRRLTPRRTAR